MNNAYAKPEYLSVNWMFQLIQTELSVCEVEVLCPNPAPGCLSCKTLQYGLSKLTV